MEKVPKCFDGVFLAKNHTLYFQLQFNGLQIAIGHYSGSFQFGSYMLWCHLIFHNLRHLFFAIIPFCAKDPLKIRIMGD